MGDPRAFDVSAFRDVDASGSDELIGYLDQSVAFGEAGKLTSFDAQGIRLGMSVLDLGCGTGEDVRRLAAVVGERGHVVGVDASARMVETARNRGVPPNARFEIASAHALPFAAESFDACRADRVFQHLERGEEAAAELLRVLKPGGNAMLIDQDWETVVVAGVPKEPTRTIVRAFVDDLANGWAGRSNASLLRKAGFSNVQVVGGVSTFDLGPAFAFVLNPALACARRAGLLDEQQEQEWLLALLDAQRTGTFYYSVNVYVTLGGRSLEPPAAGSSSLAT